jgi:N,N-dimethylformamidase beta subunit-like, C-terminal
MLPLLLALALSTVAENRKPGTPDWELTSPADAREIEGYASKTSVNGGEPIDLFVHTTAARYTIDVFRMGWYGGNGARRVAGPIERAGTAQDVPAPHATTGLVECAWRDPYRLDTRDAEGAWTTGVYLARLSTMPGTRDGTPARQSFIVFVVRDDERQAPIVFQSSVTTFAAYNNWGGKSLYAFNSGNAPARKVSFDRPYAANPYGVRLDGASDFLRRWEYNAVRFLEREGYDLTYVTDIDTHRRAVAGSARIFLSVGHDEYWSWEMREHVEGARDRGVHLAFLGADACFWQIRLEPNARGEADRTIVAYKEAAGDFDPLAIDGAPENNRRITGRWRDRPISRPEERLVGVMYAADPVDADIIVSDAAHWVFAGTGLRNGDALRGLLGYEVDASYGGGPATLERLAHSPFVEQGGPAEKTRRTRYSDMTIYTAESGALVFATGSIQWSWGLDGYNAPRWHSLRVSERAQRITRNVLGRMLQAAAVPRPRSDARPSPIVAIAAVVAAAFVLRAWLNRPGRDRLGSK